MTKLNWGMVGCGTIGHEMAQALQLCGSQLYGITCRTKEKREAFAKEYGITHCYHSLEEMLVDSAIHIIYIATPHNTHYEQIKMALQAGKHVLCEKAICVNSSQLEELVELASEKGLILKEAMTISHMPLYYKLRKRIKDGVIGDVKMVQVNFGSNKEYDVTNRFFSKELAGGALLDIGGYAVTFARFFLAEQPNVVLTTVKYFETGVDEQSGIILKNDREQMAVIALTMRAKQPKRGVITGEKGFIEIYDYPRAEKATITDTATGEVTIVQEGDSKRALCYEAEAMERAVQGIKQDVKATEQENTLALSRDVMDILTNVRKQWGLRYPFE